MILNQEELDGLKFDDEYQKYSIGALNEDNRNIEKVFVNGIIRLIVFDLYIGLSGKKDSGKIEENLIIPVLWAVSIISLYQRKMGALERYMASAQALALWMETHSYRGKRLIHVIDNMRNGYLLDIEAKKSIIKSTFSNSYLRVHRELFTTDYLKPKYSTGKALRHNPIAGFDPVFIDEIWSVAFSKIASNHSRWVAWATVVDRILTGKLVRRDELSYYACVPNEAILSGVEGLLEYINGIAFAGNTEDAKTKDEINPIEGVASPVDFGWRKNGNLIVTGGVGPTYIGRRGEEDYRDRLNSTRRIAEKLRGDVVGGRYNVRGEYAEWLSMYIDELPGRGQGSILVADAAARALRALFANDIETIASPVAVGLKVLLEQHIGLRVYFPEVGAFYKDVQSGVLTEPLSLDAIDAISSTIERHTPDVFDDSVGDLIEREERTGDIEVGGILPTFDTTIPLPPPDPLGEMPPEAAKEHLLARTINGFWRVFARGKDLSGNLEGWKKAYKELESPVAIVLAWLKANGVI